MSGEVASLFTMAIVLALAVYGVALAADEVAFARRYVPPWRRKR